MRPNHLRRPARAATFSKIGQRYQRGACVSMRICVYADSSSSDCNCGGGGKSPTHRANMHAVTHHISTLHSARPEAQNRQTRERSFLPSSAAVPIPLHVVASVCSEHVGPTPRLESDDVTVSIHTCQHKRSRMLPKAVAA